MKYATTALMMIFITKGIIAQGNPKPYQTKKEKLETIVLDKVYALWEVKSFLLKTPKSYKPTLMIAAEPNPASKYYWVKVGISNFDIFRTNYNFYVNPKTFEIFYWDQLCDSENCNITLQQWRHWRNTPGFNKMHTYKQGKLVVLTNQ
jgi:hypothetical protein